MDHDLYSILGILPDASHAQIQAAYRELARRYHPDVNKSPDAAEMMGRLNAAYAVLGNPAKRRAYDLSRLPPRPKSEIRNRQRRRGILGLEISIGLRISSMTEEAKED